MIGHLASSRIKKGLKVVLTFIKHNQSVELPKKMKWEKEDGYTIVSVEILIG